MNNRKAFKFYRSYWEVAKELSEKDRAAFLVGLIEFQFTGKEPILDGMAKFAFISQKHSILAQIEGYLTKVGATIPPTLGAIIAPSQQEKEKEKVQEKYEREIKILGDQTKRYVIIYPKVISEPIIKIHGIEGMNQFYQMNFSLISRPEFIEKYLRDREGKHLNDFKHLHSDYNLFLRNQFK